jgi:type VI secretion system protein ImpK
MKHRQETTGKVLWALTGEFFAAVQQLQSLRETNVPQPETLHRGFRRAVDRFCAQAPMQGLEVHDVQDIQYALVALADETALSVGGSVRDYWIANMLQVHYFRENVAGDGFFDRLVSLRRSRRLVAVEAYYLCLLHGFRGRYAVHGKELELHDLIEQLADELRALDSAHARTLAPDGARPPESLVQIRPHRGLVWYAAGALALASALYVGMQIDLRVRVASFVGQLLEEH